jgi:hypothetical protein
MSIARHHAEWLSLVEVSGPFLSMPVLLEAFPQGLEAHDPDHHRLLRLAHDEWEGKAGDPATHNALVRFVLRKTLDYAPEALLEDQKIPQTLHADVAEKHEILRPDLVLKEPASSKPRLLIQTYPATQELTKPVPGLSWKASPDTRMTELLHATGVRLGLVTNGERWMLVDAPRGETSGFASWYATLWLEEPITLRAFRSLLGLHRFFGVDEKETLEELLEQSAANQQEVTDQLGYQVRRAVEVLIQSLDRADQDHGRELLPGVKEAELYEAALTVMMRLVFLFCAEERELLLLGDPLYNQNYALSTIREQLRATADQFGEEVLERRHDAWCRLLVTFRAVHGGVWHDNFKLPAYGGRLFDPDRFPFLEGRKPTTTWKTAEAHPLPVNNRTVLHLLEALQVLQVKVPGGGPAEARRLSFRALDIEQIGHVYEGLLDHTAKRAGEPYLGLAGTKDQEPETALAKLEELRAKGEKDLLRFLKDETGRSEAAMRKALKAEFDAQAVSRFRSACQGDEALWQRVQPFAGLVRLDTCGYPVVIPQGSVFVTEGTDRRSSGTHYTPRSLTEPIVQYTLEPLVYAGPAAGLPKAEWTLKPARELLDLKICDMACGSGAFLVQTCRYLSERLLEAWDKETTEHTEDTEKEAKQQAPTLHLDLSTGCLVPSSLLSSVSSVCSVVLPTDLDERLTYARRIIAQRCLYGVDKNPLAVEMAKLSLWLLTLAKDKPFEFLDHAIRCGDSLVGIHDLRQLENLTWSGDKQFAPVFVESVQSSVRQAADLRQRLEQTQANDVEAVEAQQLLFDEATRVTAKLRAAADLILADTFVGDDRGVVTVAARFRDATAEALRTEAAKQLRGQPSFHWPLEFPEVFQKRGGFDAFVCNPPFMHGSWISSRCGASYAHFLKITNPEVIGKVDLVVYFLRRAALLTRSPGALGLVVTAKANEGDARKGGFQALLASGYSAYHAQTDIPWPGDASVLVSEVHLFRGGWKGVTLNSALTKAAEDGTAKFLAANEGTVYLGAKPDSLGFLLSPQEAAPFLLHDGYRAVLRPYYSGSDLNDSPVLSPVRYVIDFSECDLQRASRYPELLAVVENLVKPKRLQLKRKIYVERWWQFTEPQLALFRSIRRFEAVLVVERVSKYFTIRFAPTDAVFSDKVVVFVRTGFQDFAVLSSAMHNCWAIKWGTSSAAGTPNLKPTECCRTFPFPMLTGTSRMRLAELGKSLNDYREDLCRTAQQGPTALYNRFHAPDEGSSDLQRLRQLHIETDQAVAAAYGWTDLDLGHGFHQTKQGLRYTISEAARREVLARLLKLNHERYAEEVRQGLHEKKKASTTRKPKAKANKDDGGSLFH